MGDRVLSTALIWAGLALQLSCSGSDSGTGPSNRPAPARTAPGTPVGAPVEQIIGPAGGTVSSSDGVLTLTIPAGALGANVSVGIQPITGEAPGAMGHAYRLTPDGQTFAQPVTVSFLYDEPDLAGSAPEFLWIATQQPDGSWRLDDEVTVDAVHRTVTLSTTHFTDRTLLRGLQIRPPSGRVREGQSLDLEVKNCTTIVDESTGDHSAYSINCEDAPDHSPAHEGEDDLPALPTFSVDASSWSVNGVRGGSSTYGFAAGQGNGGQFVAPAHAPPAGQNVVAVSVRVRDSRDQTVALLVSNIEIELVCGPGQAPRASRDSCNPDWTGTSSSTIDNANPLYHISGSVTWKYDPAMSQDGKAVYYAEGTVTFAPTDACVTVTPGSYTFTKDDPGAGGNLEIDYTQEHPSYQGHGVALWSATYTDICEGGSATAGAGGAWFLGEGTLESAADDEFGAVFTGSGQTFDYHFTRQGNPPGLRR